MERRSRCGYHNRIFLYFSKLCLIDLRSCSLWRIVVERMDKEMERHVLCMRVCVRYKNHHVGWGAVLIIDPVGSCALTASERAGIVR
jgi:hypothetical protein